MGKSLGADKVLLFSLFLSLSFVYQDLFGDLPYLIAATGAALATVLIVLDKGSSPTAHVDENRQLVFPTDGLIGWLLRNVWIFIVLSWFVGVFVAIAYGNLIENILRNFFGLLFYLILPVLLATRPSKKSIYTVLLGAGLVQIFFAFSKTEITDFNYYAIASASSISDFRSSYSVGYLGIFPLFFLCLAYLLTPRVKTMGEFPLKRFVGTLVFLVISSICLIITTLSKGFILSYLLLSIFAAFAAFYHGKKQGYSRPTIAAVFVFCLTALAYYFPQNLTDLVLLSFTVNDGGNNIRAIQYDYLVAEIGWLGKGLGATLASGYSRDVTGYGFELTYVNLVHKLGIFSIPLFLSYLVTVYASFRVVFSRFYCETGLIVLGSMAYLVVGIGNPLLLSSTCVILHCMAMYQLATMTPPVRSVGVVSTFNTIHQYRTKNPR